MNLSLSDVDGELCVCWISTHFEKPALTKTHFPTGIKTRDFIANYYPLEECHVIAQGNAYGVIKKNGYYSNTLTLNLKDGNQTKNIKYEIIDIPCPKVKKGIKTRWNACKEHWEKELKSGWCMV